ncbi:hypothetical protein IWW48_004160, partial [Coemansia sp. RSA 1200]
SQNASSRKQNGSNRILSAKASGMQISSSNKSSGANNGMNTGSGSNGSIVEIGASSGSSGESISSTSQREQKRQKHQRQQHRRRQQRREEHRNNQAERVAYRMEHKENPPQQPLHPKNLRQKFGMNPTLVLGDWSATNVCWHAPIPGVGMRRMLVKLGFRLLHIDEDLTSTMCPYCETSKLKKFLKVDNPRPHRRDVWPVITSHAVLRCENVTCIGRVADGQSDLMHQRCLNRDLAAAMNFRHIANDLQQNGAVPERLQRRNRARDNAAVPDNGEMPPDGPPHNVDAQTSH